ncbi:MAG: hypothetical protein AAF546_01095 [Verrucomicrobiota bacterium]
MKMKALLSWIALASAGLTTAIAETLTVEGDLEVKAVPGEANGDLNIDGTLTVNGGNPVVSSDATSGATKWGTSTFAVSLGSTAWGNFSYASGLYSTAWGNEAEAVADYATAWGNEAYAEAQYSTAFGILTVANAYGSVVFGRYNLLESVNSTGDSWVDLDPLLEVGIGNPQGPTGTENGLNGFTILKNGKMALGAHTTLTGLQTRPETVQIEGPILVGDYQDVASVTATPGAIRYDATDNDFKGYDGSGWKSLTAVDASLPFVTSQTDGLSWGLQNDMNDGTLNTSWGEYNTPRGYGTTTWGSFNETGGDYSTAWGEYNDALGDYSTAWGVANVASGSRSTTWGEDNRAEGLYSTAWGTNIYARAYLSTALGRYNLGSFTFLDDANANNDGDRIWFVDDPILDVGIGTDSSSLANALTVLKNGKMALGAHTTLTDLQNQPETVQIEGPVLVGDYQDVASVTATPGAIRYDATTEDFWGYRNTTDGWVSLTSSGTGATVPTLAEVIGLNSAEEAISSSDIRLTAREQGASQASFILDRDGAAALSYNDYLTGSSNFKVEKDRALLEFRDAFGSIDSVIVLGKDSSEFSHRIAYNADYTASYTDRTLVDKAYVDGKSSSVSRLTTQDGVTEVLSVDPTGVITLASAQGDIPMYVSP